MRRLPRPSTRCRLSGAAGRGPRWFALVALAVSVSACGKPNPPLLPPDKVAALAALKSPYAELINDRSESAVSAGDPDLMVLGREAELRLRAVRALHGYASIYWPERASGPATRFARFEHPTITCPAASTDGEVCTLTFAPRMELAALIPSLPTIHLNLSPADRARRGAGVGSGQAPGSGVVTVRLDVDPGGSEPFLRPPPDDRPLLAPGAPISRIVAGDMVLDHLGSQSVVCRADKSPGATWERRNCTIERGSVRMTVGRDVYLSGASPTAAAFEDVAADPEMVADLRDAAPLLINVVTDPVLMRALPPMRIGNAPGAVIFSMTGTPTRADTADVRDKAAVNVMQLPWHDVVDQAEFNTVCLEAARKRQPLLIYTADGASNIRRFIYDNQFTLLAPHALLVIVQMFPAAGESAWAEGFADAIGAGRWSALTVTSKPKWTHNACEIEKVYQGPADKVRPVDIMRALLTGRLPSPRSRPATGT